MDGTVLNLRRYQAQPGWHVHARPEIPRFVIYLFLFVYGYSVMPVIDIPLTDISLSSVAFFIIFIEILFSNTRALVNEVRLWFFFPAAIWAGILISLVANGLTDFAYMQILLWFAYWGGVFLVGAFLVAKVNIGPSIVKVTAVMLIVLGITRWADAMLFEDFRSNTAFLQKNLYGILFSSFFPMGLSLFFMMRGQKKLLSFVGLVIVSGAIVFNASRGSWIACAISAIVFFAIYSLRKRTNKMRILVTGCTLLFSVWVLVIFESPQIAGIVTKRLETFENLENDYSFAVRKMVMQKALAIFDMEPLTGIGPGRFSHVSVDVDVEGRYGGKSMSNFDKYSPHNSYLGFLAEIGLVGALPYGGLLAVLIFWGFRATTRLSRQGNEWVIGIYASFIGLSIHLWTVSGLISTGPWLIYGCLAGVIILAHRSVQKTGPAKRLLVSPRISNKRVFN